MVLEPKTYYEPIREQISDSIPHGHELSKHIFPEDRKTHVLMGPDC